MNTITLTKKMLVVGMLIVSAVFAAHSQSTVGQTEITTWQYGKRGAVSITYDDGSINQFRVAVPIMNRLGLPGTFHINTGKLPGSKYTGKFIGRSVSKIIEESKTVPTNADNVFERASAARYLGYREGESYFTRAGGRIDAGRMEEAYAILDELYKKVANGELQPMTDSKPVDNGNVLTWDMARKHTAEGHEFSSHMVTHPYMSALDEANIKYELEKSRKELLKQVGIRATIATELPYGTSGKRAMAYAHAIYPAVRNSMPEEYVLELHRPSRQTPVNSDYEYVYWERGILTRTTLDEMNGWIDMTAAQNNIWLVTVIHGIDGIGWEPLTNQTVDAHFSYIKSKENDVWVATFGDAARYMKERMNAQVSSSEKDGEIQINLTHSLNKKLFDLPLTLKTYVNPSWREVSVTQGKSVSRVSVQREGSAAFVMYQAMPGKKPIVITGI